MRVLLASDGSPHSHAAADYLLAIPFRKPIDLDIVSALTPPIIFDPSLGGMPLDLRVFMDEERDSAKNRMDGAVEDLKKTARANFLHSVHQHIPMGAPTSELLQIADQTGSDLIVMGAVGHSSLDRVLLGSTSDYVATHSDTSTLIVRPQRDSELPPSLEKILIAVSGAPEDQRILDWLRQLNLRPNVQIHLVCILRLSTFYRQDVRERASQFWKSFVTAAEKQVLSFESQLQAIGLNTETHLVENSHVGEALINYAESHGCDLIVTGDSDSGLLTRVFMGSTSRYVLRHAKCSCLTVRDKTARVKAKQEAAELARLKPILA